jgi:hypothetical protein
MKSDDRIRESTGGSADEHWTATLTLTLADRIAAHARAIELNRVGYRAGPMGSCVRFWPKGKRSVFKTRAAAFKAARAALDSAPAEAIADVCHFEPFSAALRGVARRLR